jgi:hypothetical protein
MVRLIPVLLLLLLLLTPACGSRPQREEEPPVPTTEASSVTTTPAGGEHVVPQSEENRPRNPEPEKRRAPAESFYHLPLEIVIDVPEIPSEIQKPSPPITDRAE